MLKNLKIIILNKIKELSSDNESDVYRYIKENLNQWFYNIN